MWHAHTDIKSNKNFHHYCPNADKSNLLERNILLGTNSLTINFKIDSTSFGRKKAEEKNMQCHMFLPQRHLTAAANILP